MAGKERSYYEFNGFTLDAVALKLLYHGEPVDAPPKSLEVLRYLIERRDRPVPREELIEKLWNDGFVEEASLTVAVSRLRKALLAFDADDSYIQTLPRLGYRFVADVSETSRNGHAKIEPISNDEQTRVEGSAQKVSVLVSRSWLRILGVGLIVGVVVAIVTILYSSRSTDKFGGDAGVRQAYEKGEQLLGTRHVSDSVPYFQEAIAKNPNFALGHAKLAMAYTWMGSTEESNRHAARALEIDPTLAEAHAVDGFIKMLRDWNWEGAEKALRHAVSLDPNSAMAHHWLGTYLSIRGRTAEARGELRRAIEIDPTTPIYHADLCQIYYFDRDFEKATDSCNRALEIDPLSYNALAYLTTISLQTGQEQKTVKYQLAILKILTNEASSSRVVLEKEGYRAYSRAELARRKALAAESGINPNPFGLVPLYLGIGDHENAIRSLQEAIATPDKRSANLVYLAVDPVYDPLRRDPRFTEMLHKLNLI